MPSLSNLHNVNFMGLKPKRSSGQELAKKAGAKVKKVLRKVYSSKPIKYRRK